MLDDTAEVAERTDPSGEQAPVRAAQPRRDRLRRACDAAFAHIPPPWRLPLATYLVCQAILLFWWAAFYPGLLSFDTVTYVEHVTTGQWINNHSVLYDSMVWLSLHITGGLAALSFGQTAALSAALAYSVAAFRRIGVPGRWTAVAAVIVVALPPIASFSIYIWKDVPFAICSYLVVPTLAHLVSLHRNLASAHGDRRINRLAVALGLELFGICMFRLNGFLVAAAAGVVLIVLLPGMRVRLTAIVGAAIVLTFSLNLYIYPAVGIVKTPSWMALAPVYSDIAVAYKEAPTTFTTADRQLMAKVAPLAQWRTTANCYDTDFTMQSPGFRDNSVAVSGQLFTLWQRVLARSPQLVLGATICRGSIAWSVFQGPTVLAGATIKYRPPTFFGIYEWSRVRHNPYRRALRNRPLSRTAYSVASSLWRGGVLPQLHWAPWRGGLWGFLS